MSNSELMAQALEREATQEAIEALQEVLEKHDISISIGQYGDELNIRQGRNTIKTIYHGELTSGDLHK